MQPKKKFIFESLKIGSIISGSLLILIALLPFEFVKKWGDLVAKDGNLESLRFEGFQHLRIVLLMLGLSFLGLSVFIHFHRNRFELIINNARKKTKYFFSQYIRHYQFFKASLIQNLPVKNEKLILALIMVCGSALRIFLLFRPLEYDEAYTYNEFARHSISYIMSEYYVVNNHVFHTLLVKFATMIFGNSPWAIRIPVFITGLLIILIGYLIARKLFTVPVAKLAAFQLAFMPILIDKSASARGYTLITLFFLLSIYDVLFLIKRKNYFAWSLLSLFMALGIFVNPVMLFPFVIVMVWMWLMGIQGRISDEYRNKREYQVIILISAFLSAILSVLFYSQIFRHYGIFSVFNGSSLSFKLFFDSLPAFFIALFRKWEIGLSRYVFVIIILGFLINLLFQKKVKREAALLFNIFPLTWCILMLIQRPTIIIRAWIWLLPVILIGSAAGIMHLFTITQDKKVHFLLMAFLSLYLINFGYHAVKFVYPEPFVWQDDTPIKVTEYFKPMITEDDVVAVSMGADARYWYYFNLFDIPEDTIRGIKNRPFKKAYFIINQNNENLESVMQEFGPDLVFLDLTTEKMVFQYGDTVVYSIHANSSAVESQFGEFY